jgi:hypothetical protein
MADPAWCCSARQHPSVFRRLPIPDPENHRKSRDQSAAVDVIIKQWTVSPDGYIYGGVNEFDTLEQFEEKLEVGNTSVAWR